MDPATMAAISGLSKLLADFLSQRRGRRQAQEQAALDAFRDWLRRQEHDEEAALLLEMQDVQRQVVELIQSGQRRTAEEIEARLEPIAANLAEVLGLVREVHSYLRRQLAEDVARRVAVTVGRMRLRPNPSQEDRGFEHGPYAQAILHSQDELELYGADLSDEAKRQQLSVAYISLNLGTLGEEGATGPRPAEMVLDQFAAQGGRLMIRGDAGTGKTTLLRWIAVQWAQSEEDVKSNRGDLDAAWARRRSEHKRASLPFRPDPRSLPDAADEDLSGVPVSEVVERWLMSATSWRRRVPLPILVRDCKEGRIPDLTACGVSAVKMAGDPPANWARRQLEAGRALVLIDGVDETAPKHRAALRKDIQNLVTTFPDNLYIVTTRPGAVAEDWLAGLEFRAAEIAPMTPDDRARFVDKWHAAVQTEVEKRGRSEDVVALGERLKTELESNLPLARLGTNPLLAAMICALHRDRRSKLPRSQYELVDALCHMLLFRREDETPDLSLADFPEAYRDLSYPQRRGILQRVAAYMIDEEIWSLDRKLALKRTEEELLTIPGRNRADAKDVLQGLIERSGMLRERASRDLDFLHNTFKEFLAARQYVQKDSLKKLTDLALDEELDLEHVSLFAAATPEDDELPSKLIDRVLRKDDGKPLSRRREPSKEDLLRYRCRLMAVRMGAVAQRLEPDVGKRVAQLRRRVFPPRSLKAAAALAACGPGIERYLRYDPKMGVRKRVCCVRALRLLETDAARRELHGYLNETEWEVVEELSQAVNPLSIAEVVRQVSLDDLDWNDVEAQRSVRSRIADLTPLSCLFDTKRLDLRHTGVTDVSALSGLSQLRVLNLSFTGVTDLQPLAELPLKSLFLSVDQRDSVRIPPKLRRRVIWFI